MHKPSPALAVALLALFVALGGSSYAALKLPPASVGSVQLKGNSVTSPKVKAGSLLLSDFRASERSKITGPRGLTGAQGTAGPQGIQGPQGLPGTAGQNGEKGDKGASGATTVAVRFGAQVDIPSGSQQSVTAECLAGERAVGGGVAPPSGITSDLARIIYTTPTTNGGNSINGSTPNGWNTRVHNGQADTRGFIGRVICASP